MLKNLIFRLHAPSDSNQTAWKISFGTSSYFNYARRAAKCVPLPLERTTRKEVLGLQRDSSHEIRIINIEIESIIHRRSNPVVFQQPFSLVQPSAVSKISYWVTFFEKVVLAVCPHSLSDLPFDITKRYWIRRKRPLWIINGHLKEMLPWTLEEASGSGPLFRWTLGPEDGLQK